jgi:hypothetical protein
VASVFDAADACILTVAELADVAPDQWAGLRFVPHPSLRRFTSTTNSIELWRMGCAATTDDGGQRLPGEPASVTGSGLATFAYESRSAVDWVAWRSDLRTMYRSIPADEARAIDAMCERVAFGDICEILASAGDPELAPLRAANCCGDGSRRGS